MSNRIGSLQNNKIIAVWGNPGSGKTALSIKLALELADRKRNVIVILCDSATPTLSAVLPLMNIRNQSLGELLSSVQITQEDVLKKNITLEKQPYLGVMGYLHGEHERTYAQYSKEQVIDLFIQLKHIADHVIVDCSSMVNSDLLTRTALELSDQVLRLITPDLKAISYYDSMLPQLAERKYRIQNHLSILSNTKEEMPSAVAANRFGGIAWELIHSEELRMQHRDGELFRKLHVGKRGNEYAQTVRRLAETLFDIKDAEKRGEKAKKSETRMKSVVSKEVNPVREDDTLNNSKTSKKEVNGNG